MRRCALALALSFPIVIVPFIASAAEVVPHTSQAFAAAQKAGDPILVEITASWCPTCKAQKPILSKLESDPKFKDLKVFDVDFDSQKDVVRNFKATMQSTLITFKDKYFLTDGGRSLEMYRIDGDNHNAGMVMVYLPKEKILVEADDFTPAAPNAPSTGPRAHAGTVNLYEGLQRMKLDVVTIAPLHGFVVPFSEMRKAAAPQVSSLSPN